MSIFDSLVVQMRLSVHAMIRLGAFSANLSNAQDEIIWDMTQNLYEDFRQHRASEPELLNLILCWFGAADAFDAVSAKLRPITRTAIAYIFGRRYREHFRQPATSIGFFRTACGLEADSVVKKLAQAELEEMEKK